MKMIIFAVGVGLGFLLATNTHSDRLAAEYAEKLDQCILESML